MEYTSLSDEDIEAMLGSIGVSSIEELFSHLPEALRLRGRLDLPCLASEEEVIERLQELAGNNSGSHTHTSFLGGGVYDHFIPSVVKHMLLRSEFYSSYTPYQPELSQGNLQAMFEFQTMVCEITGLEVANASMYDGSTSTAEAALMAMRITRRPKVLVSSLLHPSYRSVLRTFLVNSPVVELGLTPGAATNLAELESAVDCETACMIVQFPNFFGTVEDLEAIADICWHKGALMVVVTNEPFCFGVLKSPGELGADIAVGEFQPFGIPVSYGGPYAGFFASRMKHVRQMPGRMIGETVDVKGRRGYVVTLATREQFIRREKATSNICTSQSLFALASTIYLSLLGSRGLRELSEQNLSKAEYAKRRLGEHVELPFAAPTFNEFVYKCPGARGVLGKLARKGFLGGVPLDEHYPEFTDHVLFAVTERRTRDEIDGFADALKGVLG